MELILNKLKEKTTWVGILSVLGAIGVAVKPEYIEVITSLGMAIVGAIMVVYKEKKAKKKK